MSNEAAIIDEIRLEDKIYFVRNQKVMLDFELAEIYGYETKNFNRQVKNNIEKFDEDFMFQLTNEELEQLSRCKNFTLNKKEGRGSNFKYLPYAFTEQGIYMLMTVLKGDLATKQSKALIRMFKRMKDYIIENQNLIGSREFLQLSMQVSSSFRNTIALKDELMDVEEKIADVMDKLSDVVTYSDLANVANGFGEPSAKRSYLLFNNFPFMGDIVFDEIYRSAKKTIYIIDNYISVRTLEKLINIQSGIEVLIFSDNLNKGLTKNMFDDFCKEYPSLNVRLYVSGGVVHDRYIILDYGLDSEKIYLCGGSSKDAGNRISTIIEDSDRDKYGDMIKKLLMNQHLVLK